MAHHRSNGKKVNKRNDHKRVRAATRQALEGGHVRQARSDRWNHRAIPTPLP